MENHGGTSGGDGLVWHYTDGAGLVSIVRNHVLWATASGYLNDRGEVALGYRRLEEELESRVGSGDDLARRVLERTRSTAAGDDGPSPSSFFILSAAAHWDLLAMWRCYGGAGESYAIGLDPAQPLQILTDGPTTVTGSTEHVVQQRPWTAVRYSPAEQGALAAAVFEGLEDELAALEARVARDGRLSREAVLETLGGTLDDIEQALVLIKHAGFADEREVRHSTVLVHPSELRQWPGVVRYRPTVYGMAPHLWLTGRAPGAPGASPFTATAAPLPVRAVAISPSPNGPAAEKSLSAMLGACGYDVEVRRSPIPFRG